MPDEQSKINSGIPEILIGAKNIAVVGLSDSPAKASNRVAVHLKQKGYELFPINPKYETILGFKCYPNLRAIKDKIDIVDIFRPSDQVLPFIEDAIAIGAGTIWMQLGIENPAAAQLALDSGLNVIMNRCIKIESQKL